MAINDFILHHKFFENIHFSTSICYVVNNHKKLTKTPNRVFPYPISSGGFPDDDMDKFHTFWKTFSRVTVSLLEHWMLSLKENKNRTGNEIAL